MKLELTLQQPECVFGESTPFTVVVRNDTGKPLDALTLDAHNNALRVLVGSQWQGTALGARQRERTAPSLLHHKPASASLAPGGMNVACGDLLNWVGALPVGRHRVRAEFVRRFQTGETIRSPEVTLDVRPLAANYAYVPRLPHVGQQAPLLSVLRTTEPTPRFLLQQHSRVCPPNPYAAFAADGIDPKLEPKSSAVAGPWPMQGHLVAADKSVVHVFAVELLASARARPTVVPAPFPQPRVLDSPFSPAPDELLALLANEAGDQLRLLRVGAKGASSVAPLNTRGIEIGAYSVFFTFQRELALAWAAPGSRVLQLAVAPWVEPEVFAPIEFGTACGAILRVDLLPLEARSSANHGPLLVPGGASTDESDAPRVAPKPETRIAAYTLAFDRTAQQYVIEAHAGRGGPGRAVARLDTPGGARGALRVIDSVMTRRAHPVYLLEDDAGRLFFASSRARAVRDLAELTGEPVDASGFPALCAASELSETAWVYLRHFRAGTGLVFAKLEPEGVSDPYRLAAQRIGALHWH